MSGGGQPHALLQQVLWAARLLGSSASPRRGRVPARALCNAHPRALTKQLWQRVQTRLHRNRELGGASGKGAKPRVLLGGLMRCACCGGAVVAVSATSYGCAARKDRGAVVCRGVRVKRDDAEGAVLEYVREALLAPAAVKAFELEVREYSRAQRHGSQADAAKQRHQAAEVEREISRLTDAIAQVGLSDTIATRLKRAELELNTARAAALHLSPSRSALRG